jgi:tetratricopeptide (TPR) repeat protein
MYRGLLIVILVFAPALLRASDARPAEPAGPAREGRLLLAKATDAFFDQSLPAPELRALLEASRLAFAALPEPALRDYWQSRVEYLYGFVERGDRRDAEAERRFREGYALAQRAGAAPGGDAYRLQADLIAQLLPFHGVWYAMSNGPRIRQLAEKALAMDPGNAKARLTLALFYLNAPAAGGGSDREALRILHELELRADLEREDRFGVLAWLGMAYRGRKDPERARLYLRRAQEVYPGNTWVGAMAN